MILPCNFYNHLSIAVVICLNAILMVSSEIKLVNIVFRHGDRTPTDSRHEMYPNDPYLNYSFYPTGRGQLTLAGKRREYELGQKLRNRYGNFLGSVYIPNHVVAYSSDYDRTKASLQLVLCSLFPPTAVQKWHKSLMWQPIPSSYTPRVDDKLFLSDECPEYLDEYERVLKTPEVREIMNQFEEMRQNLTKLTGKRLEQPMDLFYLYHLLLAEYSLGLPLPEWVYDYFPNGSLLNMAVAAYNISSMNNKLLKYFAGPMIRAMIDNMLATQNGASRAKIHLYSGHESNIATMLHALQVYNPHVPAYSSALIMELHEMDSLDYYVKVMYYTGIPPLFNELTIPGCELFCPFDKFLDITANIIPTNEELICNKRKTPDYANVEYPAAVQELLYTLMKSSTTKNRNGLR